MGRSAMRNTLVTLPFVLGFAACGISAPEDVIEIEKPVLGKADAADRLCELAGEAPDCDICDLQGWLGDGECDLFCETSDPDCAAPGTELRVFATSVEYTGNLLAHSFDAQTGLEAGDELCNTHAEAAGLVGNWTAFLGTSTQHAPQRLSGNGPWLNVNGSTVFPNLLSFRVGPTGLVLDEWGDYYNSVWTGTRTGGTAATAQTCDDWTSSSGVGAYWDVGYSDEYPKSETTHCYGDKAILCVETL